uniref:C2H2-type domain-containing protein n=1 Tax=Cyprinus carpio TaxID=7962 RepID=A0A8C1LB67_CYPCA
MGPDYVDVAIVVQGHFSTSLQQESSFIYPLKCICALCDDGGIVPESVISAYCYIDGFNALNIHLLFSALDMMALKEESQDLNQTGDFITGEKSFFEKRAQKTGTRKCFTCQQCGRSFSQKGNLKTHMNIHTGEKPFTCDHCGKSFTHQGTLYTHKSLHTGEKTYTCKLCGKTLNRKGNLQTHMRTHTGEKPFTCDQCGKSFTRKESLKNHMRIHSREKKPFMCHHCGMSCANNTNLEVHLRVHTGEKPFTCQQCGKSFSRKESLKDHMRVHPGERPYTCKQCGKSFTNKGSRYTHIRTHTGGKLFTSVAMIHMRDHNNEYVIILHFICKISRVIATKSGDNVRKHEACGLRRTICRSSNYDYVSTFTIANEREVYRETEVDRTFEMVTAKQVWVRNGLSKCGANMTAIIKNMQCSRNDKREELRRRLRL